MKTVGVVGVYVSWSIMQPPSALIMPPVPVMTTSPPPPPEPVTTTRPPVPVLPPLAPAPPLPVLPPLPALLILTPAVQPPAATASASVAAARNDAAPRP